MVSFKRFLYIIVIIASLGGIFLIYSIHDSRPDSVQTLSVLALEREFIETKQVDEGGKPRVWLLGDPGDGGCAEIYENVRQFCQDLHLTVAGEGRLDADEVEERDLVIFCDALVDRWADPAELEEFVAGEAGSSWRQALGKGMGIPACGLCSASWRSLRGKTAMT